MDRRAIPLARPPKARSTARSRHEKRLHSVSVIHQLEPSSSAALSHFPALRQQQARGANVQHQCMARASSLSLFLPLSPSSHVSHQPTPHPLTPIGRRSPCTKLEVQRVLEAREESVATSAWLQAPRSTKAAAVEVVQHGKRKAPLRPGSTAGVCVQTYISSLCVCACVLQSSDAGTRFRNALRLLLTTTHSCPCLCIPHQHPAQAPAQRQCP